MPLDLVDIHPHVIATNVEKYPHRPLGGRQSDWSKEQPATWEELIGAMAEASVHRAVVVQSSTTYGHDNSYLADCLDHAPDGFAGVCSIGLLDDDVESQIRYWIGERGLSGARIFVTGTTMKGHLRLDDPRTWPAWEALEAADVPVAINIDEDGIPQLRTVLETFGGLRVILDHAARTPFAAGPPYLAAKPLATLIDHQRLFLKVTPRVLGSAASSHGGATGALNELVRRFGSDRLAWGSNWPASSGTYAELTDLLRSAAAELAPEDADNLFHRTAEALYPRLLVSTGIRS